jgi:4-oxalocrotonate tautomerase
MFVAKRERHLEKGGSVVPLVQVHIVEGRSESVKQQLIAEVTDAVHRTLGSPVESIRILLYELPRQHWAVAGNPVSNRKP